jgi:hypothetical protein
VLTLGFLALYSWPATEQHLAEVGFFQALSTLCGFFKALSHALRKDERQLRVL